MGASFAKRLQPVLDLIRERGFDVECTDGAPWSTKVKISKDGDVLDVQYLDPDVIRSKGVLFRWADVTHIPAPDLFGAS